MPLRPPLRVSVARHAEKEQSLKQFLLRHLCGAGSDPGAAQLCDLQVVARSLESPLIKAITALGQDIAGAGLSVRLILAQLDHEPSPRAWARLVPFAHEIRWAKHPRLIEAHEQLVLGPETCWIGDCMRRDPAKCDAYESFIEGCGEAAGCASVSFERLWLASQAVIASPPPNTLAALAAPPPNREGTQPMIGTRH
jgi:hypothetical protein